MAQPIWFSTGSYFLPVNNHSFMITVRGTIWNYLIGLCFGIVFMFIPTFINEVSDDYIWYGFSGLGILQALYQILYFETILVDIHSNSLLKQKRLAGIIFKSRTINWPSNSYYLNENVFDSYNRISSVWFNSKSEESKLSKRLIKFASQKQYLAFAKVLKEQYTEIVIREWHD